MEPRIKLAMALASVRNSAPSTEITTDTTSSLPEPVLSGSLTDELSVAQKYDDEKTGRAVRKPRPIPSKEERQGSLGKILDHFDGLFGNDFTRRYSATSPEDAGSPKRP